MKDLLRGSLVQLTVEEPEVLGKAFSRWSQDTEFSRMLTTDIAQRYSSTKTKEWVEKFLQKDDPSLYHFAIRTLEGERLIGDISLDGIQWNHAESWVGIGIGERDFWGKGYGTDAMRVLLRYGFSELNLHRLTLDVFEYNARAIHSYEKVGFRHEGRARQYLLREGRRWDLVYMGILREEWLALQG